MTIKGIFVKATKEILYSRAKHDFRQSSDGKCFVDGGLDYFRVGGKPEDYILIELGGDKLLEQILAYDYAYGNRNANNFPQGYCGRFEVVGSSNPKFYKELVLNYNEIKEYFPCDN